MQFEMDNIIIDENGDYQDVESAINEFNKTIKKKNINIFIEDKHRTD